MLRRTPLILACLSLALMFSCAKGGFKSAEEAKKKEQYWIAIEKYKKAYSAEKRDKAKKAQLAFEVAELLLLNKNYVQAENWYLKSRQQGNTSSQLAYQLGEAQKMNEKYDDALVEFQNYLKDNPGDVRAQQQVEVINSVKEWIANPKSRFIVEKFARANSPENDFAPTLLKKEALYFTSDRPGATAKGKQIYGRTGIGYSDIFVMPRTVSGRGAKKVYAWGTPAVAPGNANTIMNDGTPTFDPKGQTMYYTQCNGPKGDSLGHCRIVEARKQGKDWNVADNYEPVSFVNDTTVDYGHPSVSPDGTRMVFSSDMPGGKGKHDLYMVTYVKRGRTWSDPINLGDKINTEGEELFPVWINDTTLMFASDGHIGLGGLDIYRVTGRNPDWNKPENLKYPLNSGGDDFGITYEEDGESGFFTSNRKGSAGDDIYAFSMTPLIFTLKGVVRSSTTGERIRNSTVTLEGRDDESKITTTTNDTGGYFFKLSSNVDYEVYATKKFYFPSAHANKTTKGLTYSADLTQDLTVSSAKVEINVPGIYYDLNSAALRPESKTALDSLVQVMNEIPYVTIELGSHTDCRSSMTYNDSLSLARSNSVVTYLLNAGIEKDRLEAKGYGERQLVNDCGCEDGQGKGLTPDCTEEMHQANRRTTAKVLSFDYKPKNAPTDEKLRQEKKGKKKKTEEEENKDEQ